MATTKDHAKIAFNSLSAMYDSIEFVDVREELLEVGYEKPQVEELQTTINELLTQLEDILPGLEMNTREGE